MDAYDVRSAMACPHFIACWDVRDPNLPYGLLRKLVNDWRQYADNYFGDYYPLTTYNLAGDVWMAWQFDRPEQGEGMIQVFRRGGSPYEGARFKLQGLDVGARYAVTDLDASASAQELAGNELMEKGLQVSIPTQPAAAVITYRKIK